jgi:hypothetical protein
MENTHPKNNPEDVEVTQFFTWIGRAFRRFGMSAFATLATLRNVFFTHKLFFLIVIAAGLIIGGLYSELIKKKYYRTTMVLSCDYLNTQVMENTIEKLNRLAQEQRRVGLAEELKIDQQVAENTLGFEYKSFVSEDDVVEMEVLREQLNNLAADKHELVEKVVKKLQIENKDAYEISVRVYNPDVVKSLETALVNYFNDNQYIKRRIEINRINLLNRKAKLTRESRKLDSLKSLLFQNFQSLSKSSRGSNNVIFGTEEGFTNPLEVFQADLRINQELLQIEEDLYLRSDFELVDGFTTIKQPESASLSTILLIAFGLSLLTGYVVIGLREFDRMLADYQPTSSRV